MIGRYESVLRRANPRRGLGETLEGEKVYYSAGDPIRVSVPKRAVPGERRYRGRLGDAVCVDVTDVSAPTPSAIEGVKVVWECDKQPNRSTVYRRTGGHRGSCGTIEVNVRCEVARPYFVSH